MKAQRPTSIDELKETIHGLITEESRQRGLAHSLQPTDVVISPYGKCGTTFLQHVVHGLRTRGDMSFTEISEVVPWLETAHDLGVDLEAPQPFPRAFKSHVSWDNVPKGGRYIVSFRNPIDRSISFYRFFEGWWFEPGSISFTDFIVDFALDLGGDRSYWSHLKSWWSTRERPDVFLLCYEDMTADLAGTAARIAEFCAIPWDDALRQIVVSQSSRDFMTANRIKFNDRLMRDRSEKKRGIPADGDAHKVRARNTRERDALVTDEVVNLLDEIWQEEITATLGFASYDEFRTAVNGIAT
jgi:hypothetical protein